jgi:hypothetical protein
MSQEDVPHEQFLKQTYLFVCLSKVGPIYFIHSHDYGHHVFPIHYRGSQDVFGLVLCEVIHKVTKMLILKEAETSMGRRMKSKDTKTAQHP